MSETKICKHCHIEKPISEYNKAGKGKWLQPYCKPCDSVRKKKHYDEHKEANIEKRNAYYLKNRKLVPQEIKEANLKKSIELLKINARKYMDSLVPITKEEKKKRKSESDRRYRENNKELIKAKKKEYYNKFGLEMSKKWQLKQKSNVDYVTKKKLRGRIYVALKRGIKSQGTMDLLGCTIDEFKLHFESLFTDDMNWEKYMEGGIHIDHKIPCIAFDLTKEEEQKKCFHYTNLQPLWATDNLKKGVKYG
jgi:hypothetical protein